MGNARKRVTDGRDLRLVEFRGKYEIVTPAELAERSDEELVELIMKRGEMDELRALEALAKFRRNPSERVVCDRV